MENSLTRFGGGWPRRLLVSPHLYTCILSVLFACCLLPKESQAEAPVVTSIGFMFETFSPYTLIRFFEFSDREWNITEACFADMYEYVEGLRHNEYWALKLYDASGYYSGGLFAGLNMRIHNPNLCRFLSRQYQEFAHSLEDYAYVTSFDVQLISAHYAIEIAYDNYFKFENIQQLICFPRSCQNVDLREILEVFPLQSQGFIRNNTYLRHRIIQDNFSLFEDFNFYVMIIILCGAGLIHATVLLVKHYISRENRHRSEAPLPTVFSTLEPPTLIGHKSNGVTIYDINDSAHQYENNISNLPKIVANRGVHCFETLLEALSLPNTVYRLCQREPTPLSGLMVIFCMGFLAVHLFAQLSSMALNMDFGVIGSRAQYGEVLLKRSAFLMDIYFLVNGAYLAYTFLRHFPKEELKVFQQLKYITKIIIQKLFGLTPTYIFILYAAQLLDKHFHSNISLEIPSKDHINCAQRYINNIFYIETFFPLKERCMPWTWFISLEVQFFIIGCLIMLLVKVHVCYALVIGISIFVIALIAATLWLLVPYQEYGYSTSLQYELTCFNVVLDNVCLFVLPYLMGLCLGYIIYRTNHNIHLRLATVLSGWLICLICLLWIIFGLDPVELYLTPWLKALIETLTHVCWSALLIWIILTCTTDYGDFLHRCINCKFSYPLEQLSCTCLLLAPVVIRWMLFSGDATLSWSNGQIVPLAIGCLLITYGISLLLYILLQGPIMMALDNLIGN